METFSTGSEPSPFSVHTPAQSLLQEQILLLRNKHYFHFVSKTSRSRATEQCFPIVCTGLKIVNVKLSIKEAFFNYVFHTVHTLWYTLKGLLFCITS